MIERLQVVEKNNYLPVEDYCLWEQFIDNDRPIKFPNLQEWMHYISFIQSSLYITPFDYFY